MSRASISPRSRLVATSLVAVMWTSVATARLAAQENGGPPGNINVTFEVDPGAPFGSCAFRISISAQGKGKAIEIPGGRFIFTSPQLNGTVINLDDPTKQVSLNITGSFHQTTTLNGTVVTTARGRNLLTDPFAGVVLAIGKFTFAFDAAGNLIQPLQGKGQLIDLCALLE